jgi:hypothetical protein
MIECRTRYLSRIGLMNVDYKCPKCNSGMYRDFQPTVSQIKSLKVCWKCAQWHPDVAALIMYEKERVRYHFEQGIRRNIHDE